jgi:hypothetical protein
MDAFGELWERHEALTQDYARLLHDDAGQVLTAIALRLGVLGQLAGGEAAEVREEVAGLQQQLDDLLERFRDAQASLGAAAVVKRGLAAGLSQLSRQREKTQGLPLRLQGSLDPRWTGRAALGAFRIIEAARPDAIVSTAGNLEFNGTLSATPYLAELARQAGLNFQANGQSITISISEVNC